MMAACEKCWADATRIALQLGGSIVDEYHRLIREREKNPCAPAEQCGAMHLIVGDACRCGARTLAAERGDGVTRR